MCNVQFIVICNKQYVQQDSQFNVEIQLYQHELINLMAWWKKLSWSLLVLAFMLWYSFPDGNSWNRTWLG